MPIIETPPIPLARDGWATDPIMHKWRIPSGYTVMLEREPDGGYIVSAPALPGCVTQGNTWEEALANIREAITLYIEDCREAGDPPPVK